MTELEMIKLLNGYSNKIFIPSIRITFSITGDSQLVLSVFGINELNHLNRRVIKKKDSFSFIQSVKLNPSEGNCSKLILKLLDNITGGKIDLDGITNMCIDIDEEIISRAKRVLKEHIERVKEIYLDDIDSKIKETGVSRKELNVLWSNYTDEFKDCRFIENISSFSPYFKINQRNEYPYLILESLTGSIELSKDTAGHYLRVQNNIEELRKIKSTIKIFDKFCKKVKPFFYMKKLIDEKNIVNLYKLKNDVDLIMYDKLFNIDSDYNKKIKEHISLSLSEGKIKIHSIEYNLDSFAGNDKFRLYDLLDAEYENIIKELKDTYLYKIKEKNAKIDKPYVYDILDLIKSFPKKGITIYVSILAGGIGTKIRDSNYYELNSYGKMSDCKKVFITEKIRECIREGLVDEHEYRASFGRYTGLTVRKEYEFYMEYYNKSDIKDDENIAEITSLRHLIDYLKSGITASYAKGIILNLRNKDIDVSKESLFELLDFIRENRSLYRDYEDYFVKAISEIVPKKYRELFLLNSNMSSGVIKKVLMSIYNSME